MLRTPFAITLTFLLLADPALPRDTDPEVLRQRARDILSDSSYQKELEKPDEDWNELRSVHVAERRESGVFSKFLEMILVVGLTVLAGLTVIYIASYIQERRRRTGESGRAPISTGEGLLEEFSLSDVERAARAGRYDEAVHLLLLLAVKRLSARRKGAAPGDLTSRELLRILPDGEEERDLFRKLVTAVELSLFGGRRISGDAYEACLDHYRGLAK